MKITKEFRSIRTDQGVSIIKTNCSSIAVMFLTDEIVRVRTSFEEEMDEASYVLSLTAWEDRADGFLGEDRKRVEPVQPEIRETEEKILFKTEKLTLELMKAPFGFRLYDEENTLLYSDLEGTPYIKDSNSRVNHYSKMLSEEECYYGFGEKGGELNKNKAFLRLRATDAMGYDAQKMDTLYKHIPFYIRLNRETQKAVGLFYHNFFESVFNMGCEKSNYWNRYTYWQADGGDIDLFFIGGNTMKNIVDNYTYLTGRPMLLPKRALGYQGSSMYYPELEKDCDDAILNFIDTIKEEGFPIDGFHLSSGYTNTNGKRYVFTWNQDRFKDPKAYFEAMNEKGAQNVPNIKPGILLSHPWFEEFSKKEVFVRSEDGKDLATGMWWGGEGAFWDFTKEAARRTWKNYMIESLISKGTSSIWNDNCEYDSILDKDSLCDYEGEGGTIGQLKPLMSTIMCKIAGDAVREHDAEKRPYVVCRSGSAGIQKYAQTWCGDNYTSWASLKYNIPIITGMGLSGQPNEGADIGGFAGPAPEEELFVRWVQNGIFQPRFSIHSASNDNTVTEPWMYEGSKDLIREAMLLRYKFIPYLYSLEYEASVNGAPIMRPLVYEFQEDAAVYDESFEFMFGRDLLVANVLEKGATTKKVYLPQGSKWYDWNDNYTCYEGGQTIEVPAPLQTIPMFIREGAMIPMAQNEILSMEKDKVTKMKWILAPGKDSEFTLYDDDGVTNNYQKGSFRKTRVTMTGEDVVKVSFLTEGSYEDPVDELFVEMIKKSRSPFWVALGDEKITHYFSRRKFEEAEEGWYYSQTKRAVLIKYKNPGKDITLTVSFEDFDLIGM